MLVIAKGYKGRPYIRRVVAEAENVFILANPDCGYSARAGLARGIGFPKNCVFEFDSDLAIRMGQTWEAGHLAHLASLWLQAIPLSSPA